jgi:hypothetical protein
MPLQDTLSCDSCLSPHHPQDFSPSLPHDPNAIAKHHALQEQFVAAFSCGEVPPPPGYNQESPCGQGMAAARSAVMEMQRQGLSFANIQDLVQNMQHLLTSVRVRLCLFPVRAAPAAALFKHPECLCCRPARGARTLLQLCCPPSWCLHCADHVPRFRTITMRPTS